MLEKICTKCGKSLPATSEYFTKAKGCKDGFRGECKECRKKYKKKYYDKNKEKILADCIEYAKKNTEKIKQQKKEYQQRNKEKIKASRKLYYEKNKSYIIADHSSKYLNNKENVKVYNKEYYVNNSDKIKEKTKEYKELHKEKYLEYGKIYYIVNKESLREKQKEYMKHYSKTEHGKLMKALSSQRRRAKVRKVISTLSDQDWKECLEYFNYKDAYTGLSLDKPTQDHIIPLNKGGAYVKRNIVPCSLEVNGGKCDNDMEEWYRKQPFFSEERLQKIYKWMGVKHGIQQLKII